MRSCSKCIYISHTDNYIVCHAKGFYKINFYFTETGSIAITRWFAPEGKKPKHFPSKSSFPFFGVEPVLVEEKASLTVCKLGN